MADDKRIWITTWGGDIPGTYEGTTIYALDQTSDFTLRYTCIFLNTLGHICPRSDCHSSFVLNKNKKIPRCDTWGTR